MLKKTTQLGLCVIVGAVLVCAATGQTPGETEAEMPRTISAPNVVFDPPNWNFGQVKFGTPLRETVTVSNTGTEDLEIKNVRSSCGCTVSNLKPQTLAPGESTQFEVGYDSTKGRKNVSQTVRITTNDPDTPLYSYRITGVCQPVFSFEPKDVAAVYFGQLTALEPATASVTIKVIEKDAKIRLKLPRDEVPPYKLKLTEVEPGREYKLEATTVPPLRAGSQARIVYLDTDTDAPKRLKIRINGYVVPPVRVTPAVIYVSPRIPKESTRDLLLSWQPNNKVNITKIECADERVSWEMVEEKDGRRRITHGQRVRITVPAGSEIPQAGIVLKIHTDCEQDDYKVINVPIRQQPTRAMRTTGAQRALQARRLQQARQARQQVKQPVATEQPVAPESQDAN